MSEDLYVGISKEQLSKLLLGESIGKRPYHSLKFNKRAKKRYKGMIRVHITLLSDKEVNQEPKESFNWA